MKRKWFFFTAVIFLAAVPVGIVILLLQRLNAEPELILLPIPDRAVVVDGQPVTRREVQIMASHLLASDLDVTKRDAHWIAIRTQVSEAAILGEVARRGLFPTDAELEKHIRPLREACTEPESKICRIHRSDVEFGLERDFSVKDENHWHYAKDI